MNRLKEKYFKEVVPSLKEKYKYTTLMAVPKIEKIVINIEKSLFDMMEIAVEANADVDLFLLFGLEKYLR